MTNSMGALAASVSGFLFAVSLTASAGAFTYQPWIDGPARSLGIVSLEVNAETGELAVNGVDSRAPTVPFSLDWGDGATEDAFFPMNHTYADFGRNYVLALTAHYGDGTEDTLRAGVYFVNPQLSPIVLPDEAAVTIPSAPVELDTRMPYSLNPNLTNMQDACFGIIARATIEYLLTAGASLQLSFVDDNVVLPDGTFRQVLLNDPDLTGGMYSLWFTTPVSFAASCSSVSAADDWPSMLHEMGHNVTLNFPANYSFGGKIDGNANAIYSETLAQIFAHATLYELTNNVDAYGLSAEIAADLERGAVASFGTVRQGYQEYVDGGAIFSSWNDPATEQDETFGTFMSLAYKFVEHAEAAGQGFAAPVRDLAALLSCFNEDWHARYSQSANSPEAESFRATLLVAALSAAFGLDLRSELVALHFPVDETVFDELRSADCAGDQGGAPPVSSGGAGPSAAGSAGTGQHGAAAAGTGGQGQGGAPAGGGPAGAQGGAPGDATGGGPAGAEGGAPSDATGGGPAGAQGGASGDATGGGPAGAEGGAPSDATGGGPAGAEEGASGDAAGKGDSSTGTAPEAIAASAGNAGAFGSSSPPGSGGVGVAGLGSVDAPQRAPDSGAAAGQGGSDEPSSDAPSPRSGTCGCYVPGSRSSRPATPLGAWLLAVAGLGLRTLRRRRTSLCGNSSPPTLARRNGRGSRQRSGPSGSPCHGFGRAAIADHECERSERL